MASEKCVVSPQRLPEMASNAMFPSVLGDVYPLEASVGSTWDENCKMRV
jgi:hypothetical protein